MKVKPLNTEFKNLTKDYINKNYFFVFLKSSGAGEVRGLMLTMVFDLEGLLAINPKMKVQK